MGDANDRTVGGRTLVLCFDGTANEYDATNTSVVRLFSYLKKKTDKQLVYYQTGVGTATSSSFINPLTRALSKAADLAVATYLSTHVIGGYEFLQNNYKHGDKICLFGFSRGAYTARALAGMLSTVGLLPPHMPEQVHFAYSIFKRDTPATRITSAAYKAAFCRDVPIEFIGCWDTVASVGALFPRILPFTGDNHITRTFRHALALDEHRAKFRSNTWHRTVDPLPPILPGANESEIKVGVIRTFSSKVVGEINHVGWVERMKEETRKAELEDQERLARRWRAISPHGKDKETDGKHGGQVEFLEGEQAPREARPPTDVKEVWFSGCHCDVGGGNDPDQSPHSMANVPLRWMIKEIIASNTPIIFRKKYMALDGVDLDALQAQADRENADKRGSIIAAEERNRTLAEAGPDAVNTPATSTPSQKPPTTTEAQQAQDYADVVLPITDELTKSPGWWILEFLPFIDSKQNVDDSWSNAVRVNFFRPRDIPLPPPPGSQNSTMTPSDRGVNIPPVDALFHRSVKMRMEAPECRSRGHWWKFWGEKDVPYRPRAMRKGLNPVYVD